MNNTVLTIGAIYGSLAIILGAFGAHALKKIFTEHLQKSFETGVKYQMYHALLLVFLGLNLDFSNRLSQIAAWCFIIGVLLFSFSIYGLTISSAKGKKLRFLGPVTPLGGLFLLTGWILLLVVFVEM